MFGGARQWLRIIKNASKHIVWPENVCWGLKMGPCNPKCSKMHAQVDSDLWNSRTQIIRDTDSGAMVQTQNGQMVGLDELEQETRKIR